MNAIFCTEQKGRFSTIPRVDSIWRLTVIDNDLDKRYRATDRVTDGVTDGVMDGATDVAMGVAMDVATDSAMDGAKDGAMYGATNTGVWENLTLGRSDIHLSLTI